jgi:hypothetical protein
MGRPLRPFRDPALEYLNLRGLERLVRLLRRHALISVVGRDATDQFALVRLAWDDGRHAVPIGFRIFLDVEAQLGLTVLLVRAVTGEALVGQDRADVAIEIDGRLGNRDR